jgi:uncharacterized protein
MSTWGWLDARSCPAQNCSDYRGRDAVYGFFGSLMEATEGSFHLEVQTVFADDERGVALVVSTASRGGRSVEVYDAHVFRLNDGKVVEFWNASTDPYAYDELLG